MEFLLVLDLYWTPIAKARDLCCLHKLIRWGRENVVNHSLA
jgi:hypothetical protein